MKIVYVVRNGFHPPFNGERVKSAALATALASCGDLHVLDLGRADYPGNPYPDGEVLDLPYGGRAAITSLIVHGHTRNARRNARALAQNQRARLSRIPALRRHAAARLLQSLRADVVVVDHPQLAKLALDSGARIRVVHAHNVESRLARSLAQSTGKLWSRYKVHRLENIERRVLPKLDQVWAVSEADAQAFRHMGLSRVHVTPNIIPDHAFAQTPSVGQAGHAAFFGWLAYPPNAAAVEYLIGLTERLPELKKLTLIGKGLPDALAQKIRNHPRIHYAGYVESIESAVAEACAILVPLAHGAGTKLKVIEALALGKPLITTPVGAEGLNLDHGVHALIAKPGPEFDAYCRQALSEPGLYSRLSTEGRAWAHEHYSMKAIIECVKVALSPAKGGMR